ncbi:CCR4-NOT transcription complex subunit 3-like [Gorilla gorilla gorilla]|uniref:CCR4-NOT transcription complex subunit 3-like n=1 Tax=Gorilla gorilla gorilla TaxID=9595 RepID=UPI003009C01B
MVHKEARLTKITLLAQSCTNQGLPLPTTPPHQVTGGAAERPPDLRLLALPAGSLSRFRLSPVPELRLPSAPGKTAAVTENSRGEGTGGGEGSIRAGRGVGCEAVGGGWVGGDPLTHTRRRVEPPPPPLSSSRVWSRDWSCCRRDAGIFVASSRPFCPAAFPRSALPTPPRPGAPASISHSLSTTHTAPPIMDPGSGGGGAGSSSGGSSSDSAPDCWDQADMEAPGPGPCGGGGSLAAAAEAQRENLSAAFSRQLNVNAKPFVPNVHAAEFVPSFLRGPAAPPPPAGGAANNHGAGSGAGGPAERDA